LKQILLAIKVLHIITEDVKTYIGFMHTCVGPTNRSVIKSF